MDTKKKSERQLDIALGCVIRKAQSDVFPPASNESERLVLSQHEVLLIRRHEPELPIIDNMWELPGGKVEKDESLDMTAKREIFEETGYSIKTDKLLDRVYVVVREYPNYRQHTIIRCSICSLISDLQEDIVFPKKVGAIKWIKFDQIDYMKVLAGSREFLIDAISEFEPNLLVKSEKKTSRAQFLCFKKDPKQKTARQRDYMIIVQSEVNSDLPYILTTFRRRYTWKKSRPIVEEFSDYEILYKRLIEISKKRFGHGYKLVSWDDDFPLNVWFKEVKAPIISAEDNIQTDHLEHHDDTPIQLTLPRFTGELKDKTETDM